MYIDLIQHAGYIFGYAIIFGILFAESGILIGFFLPGDSLLLSLGVLASQGILNLYVILLVGTLGAILGDSVGYATGRRFGRKLFEKEDSRIFKKKYLVQAEEFYEQHGKKTIVLARFVPVVRTFAPIVAGASHMNYSTFLAYNVIGGIVWVNGLTVAGYLLGSLIPNLSHYIHYVIGGIILVSVLPIILHAYKAWRKPAK